MKTQNLLAAILTVILISAPAFAWDNSVTHPNLTNRAVDYLISTNSSFAYLSNYSHFNINTKPQLSCMDEGAVKEDYAVSADWNTAVWGSQQDSSVPALSWKSHGYNPRTGETWYGIPDFANAYLYGSSDVWSAVTTRSNRYFQMGRLCHLIEDMAAPAHANGDMHTDGDDLEEYSKYHYSKTAFTPAKVRKPSTDGLVATTGLPHPTMTANNAGNFIRNVAWKTYYMASYYGAALVKKEGNYQPDSELKRMFPYNEGGLRYDDGGWFGNDSYVINKVGNNWIGWGIGINPDWWECPSDAKYFYLENIDGDTDTSNPSIAGNGVVPKVFKKDKFRRVRSTDSLSTVLASNTKILAKLYCESMYPLSVEWAAGFIRYAETGN
ncbi:MAG: hypothetical protein C4518_08690 [Desulfobacteraceae bacterium]|nr:MAG: hypothetical protein C4518_08690 [Desulfobacteraceae bacterium]